MASRKLVRDLLLSRHPQLRQSLLWQFRQRLTQAHDAKYLGYRQFGVFNEFKKQVKGEATSNSEFQKSIKELNEKVGGLKDGLKTRTKQTTEKIYKQVDGIWTEAESATKKVSASVKEKLSAATEEVKESFRVGKDQPASSSSTATKSDVSGRNDTASDAESFNSNDPSKSSESNWQSATIIGKIKSAISPKVSEAYMKLKEANMTDLAKKGYNIVKDELNASSSKRRKMHNTEPASTIERSTRTDIVIVPSNKSRVGKKWEEFKEKMRGHPVFKRISGISEPVVAKSQELAEDVRERWETSDHPVVHKIQDLNETVFGETATALSFKEIRRRDPSFSLPEFVAEVQEMVKPTLTAYMKGDVEILKKYCSPEVIERCKGERMAYESQGYFFDNKILHISDVQVTDTKMMGSSPVIILVFQTQQIYCMRDREGSIIDGGKDSIQSVFYAWAMQLVDSEELGEEVFYPKWRLREMQQSGVQALI